MTNRADSAASPSLARVAAPAAAAMILGIVWVHALAAIVAAVSGVDPAPAAWTLSGAGALLGLAVTWRWARPIARRVPRWVDDLVARHPTRAWIWLAAAAVAVTQIARLATWMTNPESDWFLTTRNPFWADHECLNAYVHGAELALRGDPNVYGAHHYPALDPTAEPNTTIHGMTVEDPFQYLPQFLLWPAAALGLTRHYPIIRAVWFALQTTALIGVATSLALWVGGRTGRVSLALLPVVLSAFPVLHALQYGQFHLAVIVAGVAAMILFEHHRPAAGGLLLSVAILSKIFPGVLIFPLLANRQWRALGWTAAFGALMTAASFLAFGTAPYLAFFDYHLPRLQSGAAFAFGEAWPEIADLVIADNQGVYGLIVKLDAMGLTSAGHAGAAAVNRAYSLLLAIVALGVGFGLKPAARAQRASAWLALLGLASLMSTGAFGDYVPLTAIWLVSLLAAGLPRRRLALWLIPAAALQYTLLGTSPLGEWFDPRVMIPVSALGVIGMLALFSAPLAAPLRARVAGRSDTTHGQVPGRSGNRWETGVA